jgi:hypothetical protein
VRLQKHKRVIVPLLAWGLKRKTNIADMRDEEKWSRMTTRL